MQLFSAAINKRKTCTVFICDVQSTREVSVIKPNRATSSFHVYFTIAIRAGR